MSDLAIAPVSILSAFRGPSAFVAKVVSQTAEPLLPDNRAFDQGFMEGRRLAEAEFEAERTAFRHLLASAEALRPEDNSEIAFLLHETVSRLVQQIFGEIAFNAEFLSQQIDQAVAALTDADEARILWLNPADADLLTGLAMPLQSRLDPQLPRGAIRVECSEGWVEHGPGFALAKLDTVLGDAGRRA